MPYYMAGDYYQGDYYQAGGLFSGFGRLLGGVAKAALSISPIGRLAQAAIPSLGFKPNIAGIAPQGVVPTPGFGGFVQRLLPGGQSGFMEQGTGGYDSPTGGVAMVPTGLGGMALCPMKGTRLNRTTYVTRGGGTSRWPQGILVHPKGTECVKTRRMNVANPRALRRALRRAQGFSKLARRFITVSKRFKSGKRGRRR